LSYVIAVSGAIGAGKTALVTALSERLGDATVVYMDHYQRFTDLSIEAVRDWVRAGADPNTLDIPDLASHIQQLKQGNPVQDSVTGCIQQPAKYILVETQFGRQRKDLADCIDFLIWIDVPLDIALARKIRQFIGSGDQDAGSLHPHWLGEYLDNYLSLIRELLLAQRRSMRADADMIVDGAEALPHLISVTADEIRSRFH